LRLSNLEAVPEAQVDAGTQRPLVMERVQARPYAASVDGVTTGSPLWWAGLVVILPALLAKSLHARASPSRVIQSAGSYVAMAAVTSARHQGVDDWEKKGDWEEAEQWDDDDDEEDWEETAKRRRPKWSPKSVKVLEKYWREDTSFKCTLNREMGSGWELQVPGLEKVTAFLPYRYAIGELQGDGLDWDDEDDELEEDFDWDGDSEELDAKVLQQAAAEAELATERIDVKILELNVADERLIVSQRAATRTNIFQVVEGPVVSIQPYGVFIDIGRPESGLLHAGQVSQERVGNLEDVFAVGDTVKCMVVSSPHMTSHVILSTKLLEPSPGDMLKDPKLVYEWADETAQRTAHAFRAGTVHEAVVTSLSDSAANLDLHGMQSLLHVSCITNEYVEKPEEVFKVGDRIKCMVRRWQEGRSLQVSTKELEVTPGDMLRAPEKVYETAEQRAAQVKTDFAVGTLHEGVVSRVARYGVFVDFEGADGLLHISQISHARIPDIYKVFSPGDHVKCVVAAVDAGTGRLSLCTKRLEPTPGDMLTQPELVYRLAEETVSQRTPGPVVGEVVSGTVEAIKPYGVIVGLGTQRGLLHISSISEMRVEGLGSVFTPGDKIKCLVTDVTDGRVQLNTRKLEQNPGDMLLDPATVYDHAEETAERLRLEEAMGADGAHPGDVGEEVEEGD